MGAPCISTEHMHLKRLASGSHIHGNGLGDGLQSPSRQPVADYLIGRGRDDGHVVERGHRHVLAVALEGDVESSTGLRLEFLRFRAGGRMRLGQLFGNFFFSRVRVRPFFRVSP